MNSIYANKLLADSLKWKVQNSIYSEEIKPLGSSYVHVFM